MPCEESHTHDYVQEIVALERKLEELDNDRMKLLSVITSVMQITDNKDIPLRIRMQITQAIKVVCEIKKDPV